MLFVHGTHVHNGGEVGNGEILYVVARFFLGCHKIDVVIPHMCRARFSVGKEVVLAIDFGREFGNYGHGLEEFIDLKSFLGRAAIDVVGYGYARPFEFGKVNAVVVAIAGKKS